MNFEHGVTETRRFLFEKEETKENFFEKEEIKEISYLCHLLIISNAL